MNEEDDLTFGEKVSDKLAEFGGSWSFLGIFSFTLFVWVVFNSFKIFHEDIFDPFPFILLNLFLSCLAAVQAPIILMSQNRQAKKDRQQMNNDYQINLKAEEEVRYYNEKILSVLDEIKTQIESKK